MAGYKELFEAAAKNNEQGVDYKVTPELLDAIRAAAGEFGDAEFEGYSGEGQPSLTPAASQLLSFGTGQTQDPRFQAYKDATLSALDTTQTQRKQEASNYFTRRGISGSSAEFNELEDVKQQLSQEKQSTVSGLGLQEFNAQNQALGLGANLVGQQQGMDLAGIESRNTAEQSRLLALAAGVETLALPDQLAISALAAKNAGTIQSGGGGGKK